MFWFVLALIWGVLAVIDIAGSWITGEPRSDTDEFSYALLSLILGYITEDREGKR